MPPWVLRAMQKAAAGGEDHPDERETKRLKWSREQHLTDQARETQNDTAKLKTTLFLDLNPGFIYC